MADLISSGDLGRRPGQVGAVGEAAVSITPSGLAGAALLGCTHPGGSIKGLVLRSDVGLLFESRKPPGQTLNPLDPGARSRTLGRPGIGRPRPELSYREGLGYRSVHLSACISGVPVLALLSFRRWRPKVALHKQSLLANVLYIPGPSVFCRERSQKRTLIRPLVTHPQGY